MPNTAIHTERLCSDEKGRSRFWVHTWTADHTADVTGRVRLIRCVVCDAVSSGIVDDIGEIDQGWLTRLTASAKAGILAAELYAKAREAYGRGEKDEYRKYEAVLAAYTRASEEADALQAETARYLHDFSRADVRMV